MSFSIRPSTDARVIAQQYLEARRQYDAAPATDKILRGTLCAKRVAWAMQLAEEIAPMLSADESPFRAVFRPSTRPGPEVGDPRELADRTSAAAFEHAQAGVGTVQPLRDTQPAPPDEDEPAIGDMLAIGGAP